MNVAIIGLGSMGKRRARLIRKYDSAISIYGIDLSLERRQIFAEEYEVPVYDNLKNLLKDIKLDCVFISTSPLSHSSIIKECLQARLDVFTEINLVTEGYQENTKLAKDNSCVLFLSSTFIYREENKYIIDKTTNRRDLNYVYHIGQYLPDWHPWESYKSFFISDKRTNGCREILAIELPWLQKAFGEIKNVTVITSKITKLDIDYNDNYIIILEHANGVKGSLIVDIVSPKAVRNFEVYGEKFYIGWKGTPDSLEIYNTASEQVEIIDFANEAEHREEYSAFIIENAYFNEVKAFFEVVKSRKNKYYNFSDDYNTIKLIDFIEQT